MEWIFVESGKMMVKVWQKDYDLVDETILNVSGDFMRVKSTRVYHQFIGLEDGVALSYIGQNLTTMI